MLHTIIKPGTINRNSVTVKSTLSSVIRNRYARTFGQHSGPISPPDDEGCHWIGSTVCLMLNQTNAKTIPKHPTRILFRITVDAFGRQLEDLVISWVSLPVFSGELLGTSISLPLPLLRTSHDIRILTGNCFFLFERIRIAPWSNCNDATTEYWFCALSQKHYW